MNIPATLKHKPVFVAEQYDLIDGKFAGDSDAKGLSLGLAQWNDRGKVDISAKVWRHTGGKWSRQSEELPLHRVVDLTLLLLSAKKHMADAYRYPKLYDPEQPELEPVPVQGDKLRAQICTDNPCIEEDIRLFADVLAQEDERLSERLHCLTEMLVELGYGRRIQGGKDK